MLKKTADLVEVATPYPMKTFQGSCFCAGEGRSKGKVLYCFGEVILVIIILLDVFLLILILLVILILLMLILLILILIPTLILMQLVMVKLMLLIL